MLNKTLPIFTNGIPVVIGKTLNLSISVIGILRKTAGNPVQGVLIPKILCSCYWLTGYIIYERDTDIRFKSEANINPGLLADQIMLIIVGIENAV